MHLLYLEWTERYGLRVFISEDEKGQKLGVHTKLMKEKISSLPYNVIYEIYLWDMLFMRLLDSQ